MIYQVLDSISIYLTEISFEFICAEIIVYLCMINDLRKFSVEREMKIRGQNYAL